jgi:hypothetical protein
MNDVPGGWSRYPNQLTQAQLPSESQPPHPGRTEFGDDGADVSGTLGTLALVGLGALCGRWDERDESARAQSFWVAEFAQLADGRRLILHEERGLTIGASSGSLHDHLTLEGLARDVLNVVLPDPDDGEDHPWSWLAELAQARGLDVSADELRVLPYRLEFAASVTGWLEPPHSAVSSRK